MDKNNAPERIELGGGWHFRLKTKAPTEHQWDSFFLCTPEGEPIVSSVFTRTVAEEFAAAMQPQVSESDDAVVRALELVRLIAEYPHKTLHEAGLVDKAKEVYAILARHRQPAAVSADAVQKVTDLLHEIHSQAHVHSTGPTIPDALWEIRSLAANALDALSPETVVGGE